MKVAQCLHEFLNPPHRLSDESDTDRACEVRSDFAQTYGLIEQNYRME